jgi:hypothetical protein
MHDLTTIFQAWADRDPMDALCGLAEINTVALVSAAGVRFTYSGV